ncbi:NADH-quinone oxidoreductase subunit C [Methylocystis sp. ATCC 49242]|uniref:hydrogenase large subunit n=1 Tax=Methylocystis sp. ATCC 49242 TaxID=622637 RepID=UPI0001F88499|nr:NADH-quinone oxidoreductase subunit C [Methylocystis sp. ATCC 49242]
MLISRKDKPIPASSAPQAGPWMRENVDETGWSRAIEQIATGGRDMLSLWSDGANVFLATFEKETKEFRIISYKCEDSRFPSVGRLHPPALRLERAIHDLYGLEPRKTPDRRRWLDHGRWGFRYPGGTRETIDSTRDEYTFLPAEGEPLHQIPVGPVHAGIIEPGHFRFSANGEVVVRLEERLGFVHKGVDQLMAGASIDRAARLAARVSGDSTVAYSLAFAQAVEAALGIEPPPRAIYLRALMAELERLANHIGDIGAICNDASFSLMHAHCGVVREKVLRASKTCFGHRLMMDRIAPGGIVTDLAEDGVTSLRVLIDSISSALPQLITVYGDTTSLQDRTVSTGVLSNNLAAQYACGGFVGRASGRSFDARKAIGYAPYPALSFETGASTDGDVDARVWVRFDEVKASLQIIEQILDQLPSGPINVNVGPSDDSICEGAALVEGFRGDILAWVRISGGVVERSHLRDPSWFQWPLLEAAIKGNIVADFPLCNKSFNCSYSGHDL